MSEEYLHAFDFLPSLSASNTLVVVSHPALGSRATHDSLAITDWRKLRQGFNLLRYDLRGHGDSPPDPVAEHYSWEALGEDLLRFVAQHGASYRQLVLLGESMGAAATIHAAVKMGQREIAHLPRLAALVLAIPPTSWEHRDASRELLLSWSKRVREFGVAQFWDYLCSLPPMAIIAEVKRDYRDLIGPHLLKMDRDSLAASLSAGARSNLPPPSELRTLEIPVQILCREKDTLHPTKMGTVLQQIFPNSALTIAEGGQQLFEWPTKVQSFLQHHLSS